MSTQGEIEAAICEGISRFEPEYMDRLKFPDDIRNGTLPAVSPVERCHTAEGAV